jgi:hypothetical protein
MTDHDRIASAVREALAKVAKANGISIEPKRPSPTPSSATPTRHIGTVRDTVSRVERDDAARQRANASSDERALEGRYADVQFRDGITTVLILTVSRTAFGTRAECKRLDIRRDVRLSLDQLENVRDAE